MLTQHRLGSAIAAGFFILANPQAAAQDFPAKPVRIITTAIGGSSDISARLVGQEMSPTLGQPVIVDNRATVAAIEAVAKAAPDGYSLLQSGGSIWLTPLLQANVPWDAQRDFAPVTLMEKSPVILVVHPSLPVKSVKDLIGLAKARPGELNFSSSAAVGGAAHLAARLFASMADVKIVWVSYGGAPQAATALVSGEVQFAFASAGAVTPHIKSNRLRAVAVTSAQPSPLTPGLPTVAASGLPGYGIAAIDSMFAPARTPAAVITRLNQEVVRVLSRPNIKEKLLGAGIEVVTSTPDELAATVKTEISKWSKVIKEAGIKVN